MPMVRHADGNLLGEELRSSGQLPCEPGKAAHGIHGEEHEEGDRLNWRENLGLEFSFDDESSGYSSGNEFWKAKTLYDAAEAQGCKPYRLPLKFVNMGNDRWRKSGRIVDVAHHYLRIVNADTSIPIIISPVGCILDGYHRIVRALADGEKYVMALRLTDMPEPDEGAE